MKQALRDAQRRDVNVNRLDLIEKLKANLSNHVELYREACASYKQRLLAEIERQGEKAICSLHEKLQTMKAKATQLKDDEFLDHFVLISESIAFELIVPMSFEQEYETAIALFEMEVEDVVKLTGAEFNSFVMDNWEWKDDFTSNTMSYHKERSRK